MRSIKSCRFVGIVAGSLSLLAAAPAAPADTITSATSSGYGLSASTDVNLLPLLGGVTVNANVSPQVIAQGTAPAPYTLAGTLVTGTVNAIVGSLPLGLGSVLNATTGLITSSASSTVDGSAGSKITTGQSNINGANIGLVTTLGSSVLSISSGTITSSSTVGGLPGALTSSQSSSIQNLIVDLNGIAVLDLTGTVSEAANTTFSISVPVGTLSIILNEQIMTGNGTTSRGVITNAVDVEIAGLGVTGVGTVDGSIILGHSNASETATVSAATPLPSSLSMGLVIGAVGLGVHQLRRRVMPKLSA